MTVRRARDSSGAALLGAVAQPGLPGTAAHAKFGVVTGSSGNMRQLQLAVKYSF